MSSKFSAVRYAIVKLIALLGPMRWQLDAGRTSAIFDIILTKDFTFESRTCEIEALCFDKTDV